MVDLSSRDLTIRVGLSGQYALQVGLMWWSFGILLAILYFVTAYRRFAGKVAGEAGYGN